MEGVVNIAVAIVHVDLGLGLGMGVGWIVIEMNKVQEIVADTGQAIGIAADTVVVVAAVAVAVAVAVVVGVTAMAVLVIVFDIVVVVVVVVVVVAVVVGDIGVAVVSEEGTVAGGEDFVMGPVAEMALGPKIVARVAAWRPWCPCSIASFCSEVVSKATSYEAGVEKTTFALIKLVLAMTEAVCLGLFVFSLTRWSFTKAARCR
jgi:hypothetical protein